MDTDTDPTPPNGTERPDYAERDCLIDGHHGWRGIFEVCRLACGNGWQNDEWDALTEEQLDSPDSDTMELVSDLADYAEAWLNANLVEDEGWAYYWEDGEFWYGKVDTE